MEGDGGGAGTTVQCLVGPLLWATESEMPMKAERIRPKDLSLRVDTSSDVMPSVSIFGRIFNRMVPDGGGGREGKAVRIGTTPCFPSVSLSVGSSVCPDAAENFQETLCCPLSCG